jgi:predicted lipid-binding transport protein (Tim44 family)
MPSYISPPPRNPLSAILAGIVGVVVMVGAFMLGFVALVVALAIGALIGAAIYVRVWWAKRQLAKQGIDLDSANPFSNHASPSQGDSLEAEYTVISKKQED